MVKPISTSEFRDIVLYTLDQEGINAERNDVVAAVNGFVTELDKAGEGG